MKINKYVGVHYSRSSEKHCLGAKTEELHTFSASSSKSLFLWGSTTVKLVADPNQQFYRLSLSLSIRLFFSFEKKESTALGLGARSLSHPLFPSSPSLSPGNNKCKQ